MARAGARASLLIGIVVCLLGAAGPATASRPRTVPDDITSAVERYLRAEVDALDLPGASVTVVDGSGNAWSVAFGRADEERPMTPQTPVLLASTSKAITAVAVVRLVEDDLLDLDHPVVEYLPWFSIDGVAGDLDASSRITPRHLLAHTSGIPHRTDVGGLLGGDDDPRSLEQRVRTIMSTALVAAPGQRHEYANANYDVLGLLVQELSGRPFGEYVRDRVFAPLGMEDSYARASAADAAGSAAGYHRWFGVWWRPTAMPRPLHSAASATMFSSSEDLGRFLSAHLARPTDVVSADGWDLLHAGAVEVPPAGFYAGGWYVHDLYRERAPEESGTDSPAPPTVWEHTGSYPNSHTFTAFVPELDRGLALVVNGSDLAVESRLVGINANLARVLGGQDPVPVVVRESPLRTYAWAVAAVLLVAELVSLVWSVRVLRRWRHGERPAGGRRVGTVVVPLLLDAVVVWLGAFYLPQRFVTSVAEAIRFGPDVALFLVPALVLAVAWGALRTVLLASWAGTGRPRHRTGAAHAPT